MRKQTMYVLKDGSIHTSYHQALHEAEQTYGDAVCRLARYLLNAPQKYQEAIDLITDRVRFAALSDLVKDVEACKADCALQEYEGDSDEG